MTDEEILIKAMDADPMNVAPMAALADLLLEQGDARGEGLAVLAQYGKVGVVATGEYPLYYCYSGGFPGVDDYGYPDSAVVDPEWYHLATHRRWSVYTVEYAEYLKTLKRTATVRMRLAEAWANADPDTRARMAFNTSPSAADTLLRPNVEASWEWLRKFAAELPRERPGGHYDYYEDVDVDESELEPVTLEELIKRAADYQRDHYHWSEGPRFDGFSNDGDFWSHYRIVTGQLPKRVGSFFSCWC